jgi:hypothetical protein
MARAWATPPAGPTIGRCNGTNLIAESSRSTKTHVHLPGGVDIATCTSEYDGDTWIGRRTRCPPIQRPPQAPGTAAATSKKDLNVRIPFGSSVNSSSSLTIAAVFGIGGPARKLNRKQRLQGQRNGQLAGRRRTTGSILRGTNRPSPSVPDNLPFSTIGLPRRMVVVGHPSTGQPSQGL